MDPSRARWRSSGLWTMVVKRYRRRLSAAGVRHRKTFLGIDRSRFTRAEGISAGR